MNTLLGIFIMAGVGGLLFGAVYTALIDRGDI